MGQRILTTDITGNRSLPFTKDSLDFLQDTYIGDAVSAFRSQVTNYQNNTVYRVYGFDITSDTGTEITFTSGVLFYNDEFFSISGTTVAYADTPVFKINTAFAAFDPTEFRPTGTGSFNVHQIRTLVVEDDTSGSGISDVANLEGIFRVLEQSLGGWDMTVTSSITLPLPDVIQKSNSFTWEVIVYTNTQDNLYKISHPDSTTFIPSGAARLAASVDDIVVERRAGAFFDDAAFNDAGVQRGVIYYTYKY